MKPHDMPPIGARIRAQRAGRGMTLRGLAREIGVSSASLISQIETDKAQPSVSTLYAISSALGVGVEDLMTMAGDGHPAGRHRPGGRRALRPTTGRAGGDARGPRVDHAGLGGVLAAAGPGARRTGRVPVRVTYPPGGASSSTGLLMRHAGTEYGYLLQGELVLTLGFEERRLGPGDAVCFESSTPHAYRNDGDQPAVGVWFVRESDAG